MGFHRCSAGGLRAAGLAVLPPRADTPEGDAVALSVDSRMPSSARLGGHASARSPAGGHGHRHHRPRSSVEAAPLAGSTGLAVSASVSRRDRRPWLRAPPLLRAGHRCHDLQPEPLRDGDLAGRDVLCHNQEDAAVILVVACLKTNAKGQSIKTKQCPSSVPLLGDWDRFAGRRRAPPRFAEARESRPMAGSARVPLRSPAPGPGSPRRQFCPIALCKSVLITCKECND